jgi:hypothetical protein
MAIGDTVQAGLMRIDSSPILLAGQAQAKANQVFGDAIGSVAKSYFDKKAKQKEVENLRQGLERIYPDAPPDLINSMSKNPTLIEAKRNKDLSDFRAQEFLMRKEAFDRQRDMLEEQKADSDRFITMLNSQKPTGELNEAGQDDLQRGLAFLAPGPQAIEESRNQLLQDPQFQQTEPVMGMTGNRFMQQFAGDSPGVQRMALAYNEANAPKPMTPEQLLDYQIKLLQEKRDQAKEEREASEFEKKNKPMPPADSKYAEATLTAVNDALGFLTDDTKKFFSTGVIGQALSNIAGTDATSLRAKLDTIKSGVGFKRLSDMREASKTGGALGNVSDNELRQLNASVGSLDPNQKPSELKKTLETIQEQYESTVRVLKAEKYAYDNGYIFKTPKEAMDFVNSFNAPSSQQSPNTIDPANIQSEIERKKQMLRARQMNAQYFDNPNVPNIGNINIGN